MRARSNLDSIWLVTCPFEYVYCLPVKGISIKHAKHVPPDRERLIISCAPKIALESPININGPAAVSSSHPREHDAYNSKHEHIQIPAEYYTTAREYDIPQSGRCREQSPKAEKPANSWELIGLRSSPLCLWPQLAYNPKTLEPVMRDFYSLIHTRLLLDYSEETFSLLLTCLKMKNNVKLIMIPLLIIIMISNRRPYCNVNIVLKMYFFSTI